MTARRPRRLTAIEVVVLLLSAILGIGLAAWTDREYVLTHGQSLAAPLVEHTSLPDWIRARRHDAIRVLHDASSILLMLCLGLALISVRSIRDGRRGHLGAGYLVAFLGSGIGLAYVIRASIERAVSVPSPIVGPSGPLPFGLFLNLYHIWSGLRSQITWAILGAWAFLATTGRWKSPTDTADRLGRWLGWAWIALIFWQGIIYVIVWC